MSGTLTYSEVNWDPSSAIKSGSSDCYDAFGTLNQFTGINSEGSEVTSASEVDFCTAVRKYLQSACWEALISNIWSQFCRNKLYVAIVCIDVLRIDICVCVDNSPYQDCLDRIMLGLAAYTCKMVRRVAIVTILAPCRTLTRSSKWV